MCPPCPTSLLLRNRHRHATTDGKRARQGTGRSSRSQPHSPGTSGRGVCRGPGQHGHTAWGSTARPRCREPTPRRRGLEVPAKGEVRVVTLTHKPSSWAGGSRASLERAASRMHSNFSTEPRSRPARSRLPCPFFPPSLHHSSSFYSLASRPTCVSCVLDSPSCDAEDLRASARPSLRLGSRAETAPDPALTLFCTAPRLLASPLPSLRPLCFPRDWGRGRLPTRRGCARLGEFLVFLGHPGCPGEPVYLANLRRDQNRPACLAACVSDGRADNSVLRAQGDMLGSLKVKMNSCFWAHV